MNDLPLHHRPTRQEVGEILATEDLLLRNLRITQCYCDLSQVLARRFDGADLIWPAFAAWASKTAGSAIRGESLPELLDHALRQVPAYTRALADLQRHLRDGSEAESWSELLQAVSDQVSKGNRRVFSELGPAFVGLAAALDKPAEEIPAALDQLIDVFRPGKVEEGGQAFIRRALGTFGEAVRSTDPKTRAELILLANLEMGLGEQVRLQGPIQGAFEAPIDVLVRRKLSRQIYLPSWLEPLRPVVFILRPLVHRKVRRLARLKKKIARAVATAAVLEIRLPTGDLKLSEDLPPLADGASFPADLAKPQHPDLVELLQRLDRRPDTLRGSASQDWADLDDRMGFITDLFRSRQQEAALLRTAFTAEQAREIRAGRMPVGDL